MSSGSENMSSVRVAAPALLLLALASPAAAQQCAGGAEPVGWIGVEALACNCSVQRVDGGVSVWSFRSEPRVLGVEDGSPADGVLRSGDEVVAVNGDLVTTPGAGRTWGAPPPATPLRVTVRRDGRLEEMALTPAPICPDDPRAMPGAPRALGVAAGRTMPPAPAPAAPPAPPSPVAPRPPTPEPAPLPPRPPEPHFNRLGWFGFGISCRRCGWEIEPGDSVARFSFTEPPVLVGVEQGTPAWDAGLRTGDRLLRIDGVDLTTPEGGGRFGAVAPGQRVRWTYERDGSEATVEIRALPRPTPAPAAAPGAFQSVRLRERIGNVEVEVVGGPAVVTTIVERGRDIIIDTGDARIRIRARQ